MRIAIVKPDFGGAGGFERLIGDLGAGLDGRGLTVDIVGFDAVTPASTCFGIPVRAGVRNQHHEYFQYLDAVERLDAVDLTPYDVVVSTQPPSYLAAHDRVVAIFFHQARRFYDLAETAVASGLVHRDVHAAAVAEIRRLDRSRIAGVRTWLAGSDHVADRLRRFWGVTDDVRPFRAAPTPPTQPMATYDPTGPAVCVSRHAWTKRTELVVQAAHVDREGTYELVGEGDRQGWVEALDVTLAREPLLAGTDDPTLTWQNTGRARPTDGAGATNLSVHGALADRARDEAYGRAGVVIAPAFDEDYGLTVLEAFERGRPVIVCRDGGGLVELVEHTGAGLVVEPTARSIAEAVSGLRRDPDRARAMADAAAHVQLPGLDDALDTLVETIEDAAGR